MSEAPTQADPTEAEEQTRQAGERAASGFRRLAIIVLSGLGIKAESVPWSSSRRQGQSHGMQEWPRFNDGPWPITVNQGPGFKDVQSSKFF